MDAERQPASLVGLLQALLFVPAGSRVYATASFTGWLPDSGGAAWPPDESSDGGICLIDTRDSAGRSFLLNAGRHPATLGFQAGIILVGSGPGGGLLRRIARRIRRPGKTRWTERRLARAIGPASGAAKVLRLGFNDGLEVPTSFDLRDEGSTGGAYLWSTPAPFDNPLWSFVRERLSAAELHLSELHLRARGAAVAIVRSEGGEIVVRFVPPGALQGVVATNHEALLTVRTALADHEHLLSRVPRPLFHSMFDGTLVLAETRLPGTLAWKVAESGLADVVYEKAREFLREMADAMSAQSLPRGEPQVRDLIQADLDRARQASFASRHVRSRLLEELEDAARVLAGMDLRPYPSHGDYGPGNVLVDAATGDVTGVIDWDTFRPLDLPGIDRVNLEIQRCRAEYSEGFGAAVGRTWREGTAHEALRGPGGAVRERALFKVGVCRFITRSLSYPGIYRTQEAGFSSALTWMADQLSDSG